MKGLYCFFLLLFFIANNTHAQKQKLIFIPVLKENAKIDSLMDLILNPRTDPNSFDGGKTPIGNYMVMSLSKSNNIFTFYVQTIHQKVVNNVVDNYTKKPQSKLGYCRVHDYKLFVLSDTDFSLFFTKTKTTKAFAIKKTLNDSPPDFGGTKTWRYAYQKGHFSIQRIEAKY